MLNAIAVIIAIFSVALTPSTLRACASSQAPWIGFRYDNNRVLFFTSEVAGSPIRRAALPGRTPIKEPVAKWAKGGDLAIITPPADKAYSVHSPKIGDIVSVALSGKLTVSAKIENYIEQTGPGDTCVGRLARVYDQQVETFNAVRNDYFLVGDPSLDTSKFPGLPSPTSTRRQVLNQFPASELVLTRGELGWSIALWRKRNGIFTPTALAYTFGD